VRCLGDVSEFGRSDSVACGIHGETKDTSRILILNVNLAVPLGVWDDNIKVDL
jgi:hypothetical protein